jgi:hypothetical protein
MINMGVAKYKLLDKNRFAVNFITTDNYSHITYDSLHQFFVLYNNKEIMLFNRKGKKIIIDEEVLSHSGVTNIEKIIFDNKYSNVYIKCYDKLWLFNSKTNICRQIFNSYNLEECSVNMCGGKLIVAGKFGILFSKVKDAVSMFSPVVYQNTKNLYYSFITDVCVLDTSVLIKTDRGVYNVSIPSDSVLQNSTIDITVYKLLMSYKNYLSELNNNDTLFIDQKDPQLQFDVVNPTGKGALHYSYKLSGLNDEWKELNSNEYIIPHLAANRYYTFSIMAHDDAWRSDTRNICLYIIPYWYQTTWGKRLLWAAGVIMLLLCGTTIVWITRRIVTNKSEKKNLQLGLELNAVYSQINPHFVFNTLNTAQYFIKKQKTDEAFLHINKFSRLLRAYIKSSRNKYISIEEEIVNLKNYIELQQERFEDKFKYEIVVEDNTLLTRKIPALLLQPIVENAINHGLFHKEVQGYLRVEIKYGDGKNEAIFIIDDDGIGREKAKLLNENSLVKRESYGDQLIKDLINVFNKYEKINIKMEYKDKREPQTGTTVVLTIKNSGYDRG